MKTKLLKFLLGAIVLCGTLVMFQSCQQYEKRTADKICDQLINSEKFKVAVIQNVQEVLDLQNTFDVPADALEYRRNLFLKESRDSIFSALSENQILSICSVLSSTKPSFTVQDIIYEYYVNKRVYDNLPDVQSYRALVPPDSTKRLSKDTITIVDSIITLKHSEK